MGIPGELYSSYLAAPFLLHMVGLNQVDPQEYLC